MLTPQPRLAWTGLCTATTSGGSATTHWKTLQTFWLFFFFFLKLFSKMDGWLFCGANTVFTFELKFARQSCHLHQSRQLGWVWARTDESQCKMGTFRNISFMLKKTAFKSRFKFSTKKTQLFFWYLAFEGEMFWYLDLFPSYPSWSIKETSCFAVFRCCLVPRK